MITLYAIVLFVLFFAECFIAFEKRIGVSTELAESWMDFVRGFAFKLDLGSNAILQALALLRFGYRRMGVVAVHKCRSLLVSSEHSSRFSALFHERLRSRIEKELEELREVQMPSVAEFSQCMPHVLRSEHDDSVLYRRLRAVVDPTVVQCPAAIEDDPTTIVSAFE